MSSTGMPPIDDPAHDGLAAELGRVILWERAQLPPVVLGQCEASERFGQAGRCQRTGLLCEREIGADRRALGPDVFRCPRHGATLERAVRRWPR